MKERVEENETAGTQAGKGGGGRKGRVREGEAE